MPEDKRQATHLRSSFQQADAPFQGIIGGIHQAGVNVAQFPQGKKVGGMFGVFESKGGGAVDGDGAGKSDGIRRSAAVEAEGFEFHKMGKSGGRLENRTERTGCKEARRDTIKNQDPGFQDIVSQPWRPSHPPSSPLCRTAGFVFLPASPAAHSSDTRRGMAFSALKAGLFSGLKPPEGGTPTEPRTVFPAAIKIRQGLFDRLPA